MSTADHQGGNGELKLSIPTKRKRRNLVLLVPAGLLTAFVATATAWINRDRGEQAEHSAPAPQCVCPVSENEFKTLRTEVDELKAKEAERQRLKEINAAVEARLSELAAKLGPGKVK